MKKFSTITALAVALLASAGCANPPARISATQSGYPEVVIANSSVESVRSAILARNVSAGWRLDSESQSKIVVSKEMDGFQESMMRVALGNSHSTPVRFQIAYMTVSAGTDVKVIAQMSAWTQMPFGKINSMEMNGNNDFNAMQLQLNAFRDSVATR